MAFHDSATASAPPSTAYVDNITQTERGSVADSQVDDGFCQCRCNKQHCAQRTTNPRTDHFQLMSKIQDMMRSELALQLEPIRAVLKDLGLLHSPNQAEIADVPSGSTPQIPEDRNREKNAMSDTCGTDRDEKDKATNDADHGQYDAIDSPASPRRTTPPPEHSVAHVTPNTPSGSASHDDDDKASLTTATTTPPTSPTHDHLPTPSTSASHSSPRIYDDEDYGGVVALRRNYEESHAMHEAADQYASAPEIGPLLLWDKDGSPSSLAARKRRADLMRRER